MAELIPLEYRIRVARAGQIRRWCILVGLTAAVCAAWVIKTYSDRRHVAADYAHVAQQYQNERVYLQEFSDLRARRDELSGRMKRIEDIQGDKVLLSLLSSVSSGVGEADALGFIYVEAHPAAADKKTEEGRYSVRLRGFTVDDTSYSQLLDRLTQLGKTSKLPLQVLMGEKHRDNMIDGQVMAFEITGNQPPVKGN